MLHVRHHGRRERPGHFSADMENLLSRIAPKRLSKLLANVLERGHESSVKRWSPTRSFARRLGEPWCKGDARRSHTVRTAQKQNYRTIHQLWSTAIPWSFGGTRSQVGEVPSCLTWGTMTNGQRVFVRICIFQRIISHLVINSLIFPRGWANALCSDKFTFSRCGSCMVWPRVYSLTR